MLHVAICDDQLQEIGQLEKILTNYPAQQIQMDSFTNGNRLLEHVRTQQTVYQIYLLDIEMPDMNGIDLARKIRLFDKKALIIFITSYVEYMQDVFKVQTFDYILKPIREKQIFDVLHRAENYLLTDKTYFHFTYQREHMIEDTANIIYFEKKGRTAYIYTTQQTYTCNLTVAQILAQLNPKVFVQSHAAFIINLQYVRGIKSSTILLDEQLDLPESQQNLPLSRKFKDLFKQQLMTFIKERFV